MQGRRKEGRQEDREITKRKSKRNYLHKKGKRTEESGCFGDYANHWKLNGF